MGNSGLALNNLLSNMIWGKVNMRNNCQRTTNNKCLIKCIQ